MDILGQIDALYSRLKAAHGDQLRRIVLAPTRAKLEDAQKRMKLKVLAVYLVFFAIIFSRFLL